MIRITWLEPVTRLEYEFAQLREQGAEPSDLEARWETSKEGLTQKEQRRVALELLDEAQSLPDDNESEALDNWLRQLPDSSTSDTFAEDILNDRILAAWTGRMAGCLLGKPVEKIPREGIRAILESVGEWPLRRYFTAEGVPEAVSERYPWNRASKPTSLRENIACMPEDDDINYTMLNLQLLETYTHDFTADDVGTLWLQMMPVLTVFTAERVAYENLLHYIEPPDTARFRNPYREWIGAQIRADIFGLTSPGDPVQAARLAAKDACLSHTGNGVYGEMFVAACLAAAFTKADMRAVVERGLEHIPPQSRLAEAIRFSLSLPEQTSDFEKALDLLYGRYGHLHWVHTINNAALVAAALLYGEGDFERSICLAVMGGWDTDCNGATVGAIIGAALGSAAIPESWSAPLKGQVRTSLKGFDKARITDLAARTVAVTPSRYKQGEV